MDTSPNRRSLVDTIALRALSVIADRPHRQSLISSRELWCNCRATADVGSVAHIHKGSRTPDRSEEHTSELQSLMRISYAVFCLKKKNTKPPSTYIFTTNKYNY